MMWLLVVTLLTIAALFGAWLMAAALKGPKVKTITITNTGVIDDFPFADLELDYIEPTYQTRVNLNKDRSLPGKARIRARRSA